MGQNAFFIIAAYGAGFLILGALIGWIMLDHALLKKTLDGFEERGMSRRADGKPTP
jgi:heme exporter protein CcmD